MTRTIVRLALAAAVLAAAGCASHYAGVPIESRPTPAQPGADSAAASRAIAPDASAPKPSTTTPAEPGGPDPRLAMRERIVADTTEARRVTAACLRSTLLPEEEVSLDSLRELLRRARIALIGEDLTRAASLALQARQLAASLACGN